MKTSRVLVTGANGFVGRHLCAALTSQGYKVLGAVRPAADASQLAGLRGLELLPVGSYDDAASYAWRLRDLDAVVHLAARVHVMRETAADPLAEFRRANVETTRALAEAAAGAGVRRFIYVSSVKVNGECTAARRLRRMMRPASWTPMGSRSGRRKRHCARWRARGEWSGA